MLRAMMRDLRAHKGRIAMTLVAIVLGVAFVVATWVLSDSTAASLSNSDIRSTVDAAVRGPTEKPVLTDDDLTRLAALPGVTKATGVLAERASLVGANGKIIPGSHNRAGTGWDDTGRFTLESGRAPQGSGELALSTTAARIAGLQLGAQARIILADGQEVRARVVGLFNYRTLGIETAPELAFAPPTAHRLLGETYTRIELRGTHLTHLRMTDPRVTVSTGTELAAEAQTEADEAGRSTRESLLMFAAVALLVGIFVIANTFTMLVTQRVRQFALLRAVGATRRQIRRAVLLEAGALGVTGATIGVVAGIALGVLGMWAFAPPADTVTYRISPPAIAIGYAVGIGITTIAAYGSARRAAAVPPLAALRTDATQPRHTTLFRTVTGAALLTGGVAAVATTSGHNLSTTERVVCMGAGIVAWLGILLLAPVLANAVLRPLTGLLSRRGPVTRLATRNAARDPRRTAATSSALLVGLALVCAFATLGETLTSTFGAAVRNTVPPTTTILKSASGTDPLSTDVFTQVRKTPGVTAAAADRYTLLTVSYKGGTSSTSVSAIEPEGLTTVLTPHLTEGTANLRDGVVAGANEAATLGLTVGDEITLNWQDGTKTRQHIVGLADTVEGQPLFYVDVTKVPQWFERQVTTIYATGPSPTAVRNALDAKFRTRPDVEVTTREGVIAKEAENFQTILSVMYAMFGAAILIAVFGVINTLALSVRERTQEIALLRAIGASRKLIRRTIRTESTIISTYGGILGVIVGILFGAVMQHATLGNPLFAITTPTTVIITALAGMLTVGVLSATWPAKQATRTRFAPQAQTP